MTKAKIDLLVTFTLSHTDKPDYNCPQRFAELQKKLNIEVEIPIEAEEVFRKLWHKNQLTITIIGNKNFSDGEEIF